ncbi:radical SAM-linked protein [Herbihabitans rhizosphaerae]|uniref:Radical SAM-linked protein n=1 Tax=Herbihabitans rhizosphaerae TaxID=1872711 RepID=A0A4V2ERI1_9PSEU|nr:TIGR03936 family radical SAM-associated protein [Herbihabitans rhizosphaerae]RZS31393.1 radical SAM-linked protein [Herbihabitans rhizosphaerae]
MQKLRLRYAKRGRLRFTSHRDIARAFERALRRAHVPMAYSQGFNPHPKISWVGAAPTGVASEAEYVEIQVVSALEPAGLLAQLDEVLPDGLDLVEAVQAAEGGLAERIEASRWRIELPGVPAAVLADAVRAALAAEEIAVRRLTKNGYRTIDARGAIVTARVEHAGVTNDSPTLAADTSDHGEPCGILDVVVRQTTPAVRPDDVLNALRVVADLEPPVPAKATRMAQGRLDDDGRLSDPLAPDKAAAGWAPGEQKQRHDVD